MNRSDELPAFKRRVAGYFVDMSRFRSSWETGWYLSATFAASVEEKCSKSVFAQLLGTVAPSAKEKRFLWPGDALAGVTEVLFQSLR